MSATYQIFLHWISLPESEVVQPGLRFCFRIFVVVQKPHQNIVALVMVLKISVKAKWVSFYVFMYIEYNGLLKII